MLIIALYSALVFVLKEVLAIIPNVEIVTFLLSFSALIFPLTMSISIPLVFNLCEILLRGFSTWIILYFIAWPLLIIIICGCKKMIKKHWWSFIIINSLWGFCFGTLDAFIHLLLYGSSAFYLYWINGLVFDAIHGVSNAIVASVLYQPIMHIWQHKLKHYIINWENNILLEEETTAKKIF